MNQTELMERRKIFLYMDLTEQDHREVKERLKAVRIPDHMQNTPAAYLRMKKMDFENEILDRKQFEYDSNVMRQLLEFTKECCKCRKELINEGGHVIKSNRVYCFDCYIMENPIKDSWRNHIVEGAQ